MRAHQTGVIHYTLASTYTGYRANGLIQGIRDLTCNIRLGASRLSEGSHRMIYTKALEQTFRARVNIEICARGTNPSREPERVYWRRGSHRMTSVNRPLSPRRVIRLLYVDSFRGRARAGARAHYARARYEGCSIPGIVYIHPDPRDWGY